MKRAVAWLKTVFLWCRTDLRLELRALLVLVAAALFVFHPGVSETQVRLTGLLLQFLGLSTVFFGIRQTRKLFGRPSILQLISEKVSRFPRWRRDVRLQAEAGAFTLSGTGSVTAHGWHNVDPTAPIEAQINALKQNVERMNERLIHMQKETEAELRKHSDSLRQEQQIREKEEKEIRKLLEDAETGGLDISFIGLIWLTVGLILSTVSHEIAQWMR